MVWQASALRVWRPTVVRSPLASVKPARRWSSPLCIIKQATFSHIHHPMHERKTATADADRRRPKAIDIAHNKLPQRVCSSFIRMPFGIFFRIVEAEKPSSFFLCLIVRFCNYENEKIGNVFCLY